MRVVVDIPPELVDEIRTTVQSGGYEDPEEFLVQALRTQLELEQGEQETLLSFSEAVGGAPADTSSESTVESTRNSSTSREEEETRPQSTLHVGEPENLSLREFDVYTVAPPEPHRLDGGPLWGQYNRIFPMKLSVRRLAVYLAENHTESAPYDQFREATARSARNYGLRIKQVDQRRSRGRGEKLSAGLPTGDKEERSLERYKTHFLGQIKSNGDLIGALPDLKFVDIDPETREFGLTSFGLEFARTENPILDEDLSSDDSLSESEKRFYLNHVAENHEPEYEAMELVATGIHDGIDRPDPLSERVGALSDDWSDAQASTVRSGLTGRMSELGLLSRRRVGSRGVGYELTDDGRREFL